METTGRLINHINSNSVIFFTFSIFIRYFPDGNIFVYDVTDEVSFDYVREKVQDVQHQQPNAMRIILGNKCDMKALVDLKAVESFSRENNAKHFKCSAHQGTGIEEAFYSLVKDILNTKDKSKCHLKSSFERSNSIFFIYEITCRIYVRVGLKVIFSLQYPG